MPALKLDTSATEERSLSRARAVATLCSDHRAVGIRLLDLRGLCGYADFLVVATVASRPQMRAVLRDTARAFAAENYRPLNPRTGCDERWLLVDYGDIVIHLFSREARQFYGIDEMWADAPELDFPHTPEYDDL